MGSEGFSRDESLRKSLDVRSSFSTEGDSCLGLRVFQKPSESSSRARDSKRASPFENNCNSSYRSKRKIATGREYKNQPKRQRPKSVQSHYHANRIPRKSILNMIPATIESNMVRRVNSTSQPTYPCSLSESVCIPKALCSSRPTNIPSSSSLCISNSMPTSTCQAAPIKNGLAHHPPESLQAPRQEPHLMISAAPRTSLNIKPDPLIATSITVSKNSSISGVKSSIVESTSPRVVDMLFEGVNVVDLKAPVEEIGKPDPESYPESQTDLETQGELDSIETSEKETKACRVEASMTPKANSCIVEASMTPKPEDPPAQEVNRDSPSPNEEDDLYGGKKIRKGRSILHKSIGEKPWLLVLQFSNEEVFEGRFKKKSEALKRIRQEENRLKARFLQHGSLGKRQVNESPRVPRKIKVRSEDGRFWVRFKVNGQVQIADFPVYVKAKRVFDSMGHNAIKWTKIKGQGYLEKIDKKHLLPKKEEKKQMRIFVHVEELNLSRRWNRYVAVLRPYKIMTGKASSSSQDNSEAQFYGLYGSIDAASLVGSLALNLLPAIQPCLSDYDRPVENVLIPKLCQRLVDIFGSREGLADFFTKEFIFGMDKRRETNLIGVKAWAKRWEAFMEDRRKDWSVFIPCNTCGARVRKWVQDNCSGSRDNVTGKLSREEEVAEAMWIIHTFTEEHRIAEEQRRKRFHPKKGVCICKRPFFGGEVECEKCKGWFHPECDILLRSKTLDEIKKMRYKCALCRGELGWDVNELPYLGMVIPKLETKDIGVQSAKGESITSYIDMRPPNFSREEASASCEPPPSDKYAPEEMQRFFKEINMYISNIQFFVEGAEGEERSVTPEKMSALGSSPNKLLTNILRASVNHVDEVISSHLKHIDYWMSYKRSALIKLPKEPKAFFGMKNFIKGLHNMEPEEALERMARHPDVETTHNVKKTSRKGMGGTRDQWKTGISEIIIGSQIRGLSRKEQFLSRYTLSDQLLRLRKENSSGICMTLYLSHQKIKKKKNPDEVYGVAPEVLKVQANGLRTCGMKAAHLILKVSGEKKLHENIVSQLAERTNLLFKKTSEIKQTRRGGPETGRTDYTPLRIPKSLYPHLERQYHHTFWHQDSLTFYFDNTKPGTLMTTLYHQMVGESCWNATCDMRLGAALNLLQICYGVCQLRTGTKDSKDKSGKSLLQQIREMLVKAYRKCKIDHVTLRVGESLYVPSWSTHEVISPEISCAYAQHV
ncbi:hypothetical protein AAMO2058_000038400 [Amorphochlora amoebiformis]